MNRTWPADKIERRKIETLIPYVRNSRTHSDAQVAQIAASIKEWGFTNPILVDDSGQIIAGHGRVMAARKLGMSELPVMVASGWTEAQKRAYVIADNKLALNAGWDDELLSLELGELDGLGFDLELTGFTLDELDAEGHDGSRERRGVVMTNSKSIADVAISSDQLRAYLQIKHWREDGKIRSVATVWHRADDEDAEVLLPISHVKDYRQRMRDALQAVATFEARDVPELLKEVKQLFANVIAVRVISEDTNDGTIPINDGVLLIAKAKELLSAAARSLHAKRKQFTRGAPKETKDYLETLLLGQTEVGSYVVNVIAPVQAIPSGLELATPIPMAQAITSSLVSGLAALEKASGEYQDDGDFSDFDAAVLAGASSNMCDALLGFSGEKHSRNFEITVTTAPSPLFEESPKTFVFDRKRVEVLEKATNYYKGDYVLADRRLTGYELCWSMNAHKRMIARFLWSGFTAKERNENRVHPTQKPIALHEWFFERWGKPSDTVVDLFGGSGSTLIACEKTGRAARLMELDPKYCDVIVKRWQDFTGKQATLESTGQTFAEVSNGRSSKTAAA